MGTTKGVLEAQTSEQAQTAFIVATERWKALELKVAWAEPQRRALRRGSGWKRPNLGETGTYLNFVLLCIFGRICFVSVVYGRWSGETDDGVNGFGFGCER
nr:hypothetical protein Iba_chr04cCG12270 [Ipomoea batatas]